MKQKIWLFVLCGILLLAGIVGSILVLQRPDTSQVEIIQDGTVLYSFDLDSEEDQVIEVEYNGQVNRIEIRDHQIHVLEADCPDQVCVNMGWLRSAAPIVCLPNHLVIQFTEGSDSLDAVAG
ncbi:MAG: NusG domain II-containing protein [Candidatus Merdisoma sp.]|jgi:hypothetical protein